MGMVALENIDAVLNGRPAPSLALRRASALDES